MSQHRRVSAQNAKDAADDYVANLRLSPADKGRTFQLVTFDNDEDCRYFYPRRSLHFHRQINTFISRALRDRYGVRVRRYSLTRAEFDNRREVDVHMGEVPMTAEQARRRYADRLLTFLQ